MLSKRDKATKRKFRYRRVKPHLRMAELSLVSFSIACSLLAFIGVCFVAERTSRFVYLFATLPAAGAWLLSTWLLIRLYVTWGIMTAKEGQDYPGWPGKRKRGYAESWYDESTSKLLFDAELSVSQPWPAIAVIAIGTLVPGLPSLLMRPDVVGTRSYNAE